MADAPIVLSYRQQQVLELMADGHTSAHIGTALLVSEATVKTTKERLFRKLGANTAAQAVAVAFRHGFLAVDPAVAEAASMMRAAAASGHRLALVAWDRPGGTDG
jgi:DNA-binding CsgD family transcriptional regulator